MKTHLLVTNDFPPKVGGIQSYLWELWRRLPPESFTVLTTPYDGAEAWDREQPFRVVRTRQRVLFPTTAVAAQINSLALDIDAPIVILDPALPLGALGRRLRVPYGLVLHGAEVTVPGRLPGSRAVLRSVLRGATTVIAAGPYPLGEAERAAGRALPAVVVPPGVDCARFRPLDESERIEARNQFGLGGGGPLIVSVSRLVPRKGMDVLLEAAARLARHYPGLLVAIAGGGRDRDRLERLATSTGAPVRFLGRVPDDALPALYGCADVFAMLCRDRWAGLEQEGFGIVFLEAAACGVPQVAGASGGAADAVADGETGLIVANPRDTGAIADALDTLLGSDTLRTQMGTAARARAESYDYDALAANLATALQTN